MGREPDSFARSVLAPGTEHAVLKSYLDLWGGPRVEILLEPAHGQMAHTLDKSRILELLEAEVLSHLDYFLWLAVPREMFHALIDDRERFEQQLRELSVRRVWPNLPLAPQASTGSSALAQKMQLALSTIAWNATGSDGAGVTWAVVDTDVWDGHPDFSDAAISRYSVTKSGVSPNTSQYSGPSDHGTHVTGIFHAVAPRATIIVLALPFTPTAGARPPLKLTDAGHLAKALDWVKNQANVRGVNISLGMPPQYQDPFVGHGPGCKEISVCRTQDQIVVVAAGNYGERQGAFHEVSISDPANAREALVVGACDTEDPVTEGIWSSSSHGPTADGRSKPDLVAPGVDIQSCSDAINNLYTVQSGTSQAAAFVSGACAVLLSSRTPTPSADRVIDALRNAAKDLGRMQTYQGHGLLQLGRAAAAL